MSLRLDMEHNFNHLLMINLQGMQHNYFPKQTDSYQHKERKGLQIQRHDLLSMEYKIIKLYLIHQCQKYLQDNLYKNQQFHKYQLDNFKHIIGQKLALLLLKIQITFLIELFFFIQRLILINQFFFFNDLQAFMIKKIFTSSKKAIIERCLAQTLNFYTKTIKIEQLYSQNKEFQLQSQL
ncbi:transmembrane protein, putative (macronuclear) [Tetrahymena thermophila SB210]|uniref:Transmembrane protein, putative n=1 Tax=Tetrahymena thermophila (strain SB210) TaxID=312017 RepID=W7XGI5_TETTS|nr:transmembrane protein, putative [Tetrahymena thermophila SB210]EWS76113.1 transmembrane protein, putative [Tetrahymena thermophila SB210]|eukprot:XP_012651353.1 transmembrane protein, putative [Tetrahymena thermophila SB210]